MIEELPDHSGTRYYPEKDWRVCLLSMNELIPLAETRLRALVMKVKEGTSYLDSRQRLYLGLLEVLNVIAAYDTNSYTTCAIDVLEAKAERKYAFEIGLREAAKAAP